MILYMSVYLHQGRLTTAFLPRPPTIPLGEIKKWTWTSEIEKENYKYSNLCKSKWNVSPILKKNVRFSTFVDDMPFFPKLSNLLTWKISFYWREKKEWSILSRRMHRSSWWCVSGIAEWSENWITNQTRHEIEETFTASRQYKCHDRWTVHFPWINSSDSNFDGNFEVPLSSPYVINIAIILFIADFILYCNKNPHPL